MNWIQVTYEQSPMAGFATTVINFKGHKNKLLDQHNSSKE
jgi:hypothetical protein